MQKDIVFIDTSVYVKEKYFSEGNAICALFKLAKEGLISLVSTDITNQEVFRHMRKDCLEAFSKMKKNCNVLRNVSLYKNAFDRANKVVVEKEIQEVVEKNMKAAQVYTMGYNLGENDVKYIFDAFFREQAPFSDHKKSEFPDAFVLAMLDNYGRNAGERIVVLSDDDDMKRYASDYLVAIDYKEYITEKLVVKEKLDDIKVALDDQYGAICTEIREECEKELDEPNLYIYNIEGVDVTYVTVNNVNVKFDKDNIYIYNEDDGVLGVEVECEVDFSVDVEFENTSNAYYDSEDKQWYGTESDRMTVTKTATTYVDLVYNDKEGLKIDSFDVDDVLREI